MATTWLSGRRENQSARLAPRPQPRTATLTFSPGVRAFFSSPMPRFTAAAPTTSAEVCKNVRRFNSPIAVLLPGEARDKAVPDPMLPTQRGKGYGREEGRRVDWFTGRREEQASRACFGRLL